MQLGGFLNPFSCNAKFIYCDRRIRQSIEEFRYLYIAFLEYSLFFIFVPKISPIAWPNVYFSAYLKKLDIISP